MKSLQSAFYSFKDACKYYLIPNNTTVLVFNLVFVKCKVLNVIRLSINLP